MRHAAHGTGIQAFLPRKIIPYREPNPVAVGADPAPWQHGLRGAASHPGNSESLPACVGGTPYLENMTRQTHTIYDGERSREGAFPL